MDLDSIRTSIRPSFLYHSYHITNPQTFISI